MLRTLTQFAQTATNPLEPFEWFNKQPRFDWLAPLRPLIELIAGYGWGGAILAGVATIFAGIMFISFAGRKLGRRNEGIGLMRAGALILFIILAFGIFVPVLMQVAAGVQSASPSQGVILLLGTRWGRLRYWHIISPTIH